MILNENFWNQKKVLITGHTGFKGSWLCLLLSQLNAKIVGYALNPPTVPSLFEVAHVESVLEKSVIANINDYQAIYKTIDEFQPEIILHLSAQPLVRYSYENPIETYQTNVIGTVNLLEAVRKSNCVKAVVNITTDKCYYNNEWLWAYRENDRLGGFDPYSNSKACAELVTASFRDSFFRKQNIGLATVRAGNVIGGGDWATDRLIPDIFKAILANEKVVIRNPHSIRPWQHVLEPLVGYLLLAEKLYNNIDDFSDAFNFASNEDDAKPVEYIVKQLDALWISKIDWEIQEIQHNTLHEAKYLKLDSSKAKIELGWKPRWNLNQTLEKIVEWYQHYQSNQDMKSVCIQQLRDYLHHEI